MQTHESNFGYQQEGYCDWVLFVKWLLLMALSLYQGLSGLSLDMVITEEYLLSGVYQFEEHAYLTAM